MSILIIAPHPDDEIWGTGGLLIQAKKRNQKVVVVYITTGATIKENKKKSIARENAVKIIGEKLNLKQYFLRNPERSLFDIKRTENIKKYIENIIKKENIKEIYVTAYEGGHPDHDICNFLVSKMGTKIKKYEYCMYNNRFGLLKTARIKNKIWWDKSSFVKPWLGRGRRLKMSNEEMKEKNRLFYHYQLIAEKPLGEMRINIGSFPRDLIRKLPKHSYSKRPHLIYPLNYEIAFKIPFNKFKQLAEKLR